jgi:GST-like protein
MGVGSGVDSLAMLELYSWTTPNGDKLHIMLEELGLPYRVIPVNLGAGEQNAPEFRAINPNGKIPALVDPEGPDGEKMVVFESGAILVYLGEKTGKFLPRDTRGRFAVLQWLMFQMSAIGPQFGLLFRARNAAEPVPEQVERFAAEVGRIFGVIEQQLAGGGPFLAGEYSIADIASFPWMRNHKALGIEVAEYPKVRAWLDEIAARPAVQRGLQVLRSPRA